MKVTILVLSLLSLVACYQMVPIPPTYDGLTIGQKGAPVQIEAFYDLLCPASAAANEQINALFTNSSFAQYLPQISFTYHVFPLPYHDYAFSFAQLYRRVFNNYNAITTFNFINFIFDIQDQYYNQPMQNVSRNTAFNKIAEQVHDKFPQISKSEVTDALTNSTLGMQARYSWKYGCSRQVSATPQFFLNGVLLNGAESFNSKTWAQTLLPYLQQAPKNGVDINQFYSQ